MAVQNLILSGRRFVLLPAREYEQLCGRARKNGAAGGARRRHRMTAQDWGDVAEAKRRLADPNEVPIPWSEARKRLGSG